MTQLLEVLSLLGLGFMVCGSAHAILFVKKGDSASDSVPEGIFRMQTMIDG